MKAYAVYASLVMALSALLSRNIVEQMQFMLSYSAQQPLPENWMADVAIVLGYALTKRGDLTGPLRSRVEVGVDAFLQGRAAHLIFSGAHPDRIVPNSEAEAMEAHARHLYSHARPNDSVPGPETWVLEEKSVSTRTNAQYSLDIAMRSGWRSVLVVTNPFHQYRAAKVFDKVVAELTEAGLLGPDGMQVYVADTPFAPHGGVLSRWLDWLDLWREYAAIKYYQQKGYMDR